MNSLNCRPSLTRRQAASRSGVPALAHGKPAGSESSRAAQSLRGSPALRRRDQRPLGTLHPSSRKPATWAVMENVVEDAVPEPNNDDSGETSSSFGANLNNLANTSYSKLYDMLMSSGKEEGLNMGKQVPKPSKEAQSKEESAQKLWLSDVFVTVKRNYFFGRKFLGRDLAVLTLVSAMHLGLLFAPATFSWGNFGLAMGLYFVTGCIGITFGYHRLIAHKSFVVPKWLEYVAAYCGALSIQGDPIEWASTHRYHHLHTDTPKDPHSTYEGAWWSHAGWFLDNEATLARTEDHSNAKEMRSQPFYKFLQKTYVWHILASLGALYAIGGFPALIWGGCVRTCIVWHITWSINSCCHIYGRQEYNTKDLSKNNWLFGILAWGEGWHNNHHAFEYSARHGLKWWQFDLTWIIIRSLEVCGLASRVKLPSAEAKRKLAFE